MKDKNYIIAIDGPSGAGKSSLSKLISKKLRISYIDTGAMYRACALYADESGVNPSVDSDELRKLLENVDIDFGYSNDEQRLFLNGVDVSEKIRQPKISTYASDISAIVFVRDKLVEMQRNLSAGKSVLMDGRDIGTNVFPNADVKIYLTADVNDRAKRRFDELTKKGVSVRFEDVLSEMISRDENDKNRKYAPLKKADDAVLVDTTGNEFEKSFDILFKLITEKIGE